MILLLRENLEQLAPQDVKAMLVIKAPLGSLGNLVTLELKEQRYYYVVEYKNNIIFMIVLT